MSDLVDPLANKVEDNEEELDLSLKKKKKKKAAPAAASESTAASEESTEPKTDADETEPTAAPAKKKVIKIIKKVIKKVPAGSAAAAASTPSDATAAPSGSASGPTVVKKIVRKVAAPAADGETTKAAPAKKVVKKAAPAAAADAPVKAAPAKKKAASKKVVTFGENTNSKPGDEDEVIEGFVKRPEDDFYSVYVSKSSKKSNAKKDTDWMADEDEEDNDDEDDENEKPSAQDDDEDNEDDDDELNFSKTKKKKKRSTTSEDAEAPKADDLEDEDDDVAFGYSSSKAEEGEAAQFKETWLESDREYRYEELLGRIYHLMSEFNPDMIKSKNRYTISPPSVYRDGTKKSVWANFPVICNEMHRPIDHVLAYSKAELGTTASIDGNQRMVIKGRFQPRQIESVVRHYIAEYVSCRTCKSPDTILKKENRLHFMQCKSCGSTRSVAPIKAGFQAQIGHRIRT